MFVVVDGNRPAVLLEDAHALLEELVSRIEHLPELVGSVGAVFRHDEDCIDGELVPAASERLCDGRVDGEPELAGSVDALFAFRRLVHVHRHDAHVRAMPLARDGVAHQKPVDEVLRVRQVAVDGGDDGDARR